MEITLLIMENHEKNHGIVFLNFCWNPFYIIPCYFTDLDIMQSGCDSHFFATEFYKGIKGKCPYNGHFLIFICKSWVKGFRINPEFMILRLTFHRKSASKS